MSEEEGRTWSTWSNVAYVGTAIAIYLLAPGPASLVVGAFLVFLAVGSAGMHATRDWGPWPSWEAADHAGMHAVYSAVAAHAFGLPWWLVALIGVATPVMLEAWRNVPIRPAATAYMVAIIVGGALAGAWAMLLFGFAAMGLGLLAHRRGGDLYHGLWHVLTAFGTVFLYLVGA